MRQVVGSIATRGNLILSFHRSGGGKALLSSATQHAMPPEFGGKWGTECFNTRFPVPNLLCAGYSVKQEKKYIKIPNPLLRVTM